ncbi:hypothetical protein KM043_011704 [Ampulex compressa]|nr:hypothetical protein KM043_011704 [Ampulex compressa]
MKAKSKKSRNRESYPPKREQNTEAARQDKLKSRISACVTVSVKPLRIFEFMFMFSMLGVIFFGIAGLLFIVYAHINLWRLISLILCLLISLLFLAEVMMLIAFWKRRCGICKRCCYSDQSEAFFQKGRQCPELCTERTKCDLTTSVSSVRVPASVEDSKIPDHGYRKFGYARRREYVDSPTNVPSVSKVDIAQVQTEPKSVSVVESQTKRREMKEVPIQTTSRCELCHRQMQPYFSASSSMPFPTQPNQQQATECTTCPAVLQFIRGGISVPCCSRCVAGFVQIHQQQESRSQKQQQQQQQQQQLTQELQWTIDQDTSGTMTSAPCIEPGSRLTGTSETIAKVTLTSLCVRPNKRTQTSSEVAPEDDASTGRVSRRVNSKDRKSVQIARQPEEKSIAVIAREKEEETMMKKSSKDPLERARISHQRLRVSPEAQAAEVLKKLQRGEHSEANRGRKILDCEEEIATKNSGKESSIEREEKNFDMQGEQDVEDAALSEVTRNIESDKESNLKEEAIETTEEPRERIRSGNKRSRRKSSEKNTNATEENIKSSSNKAVRENSKASKARAKGIESAKQIYGAKKNSAAKSDDSARRIEMKNTEKGNSYDSSAEVDFDGIKEADNKVQQATFFKESTPKATEDKKDTTTQDVPVAKICASTQM